MLVKHIKSEFWGQGSIIEQAGDYSFELIYSDPHKPVAEHKHTNAHFLLTIAGAYMSTAGHAPLISTLPQLIYSPPDTVHSDHFFQGRGEFLAISVNRMNYGERPEQIRDVSAYSAAYGIVQALKRATFTHMLLEGLALQLKAAVLPIPTDHKTTAKKPPRWLREAFELSFLRGDRSLTVSDMADLVGVHPVHLARVYRDFLGCSPGEALRGKRLERAAAMLGSTIASLADVAHVTGYADQAHMTHAFQRKLGITPCDWQRKMLQKYKNSQ